MHNQWKISIFAVETKHNDMINREIIRIKIVQLTYAYYQNGNKNIDSAEKELLFSLSKAYDLYNYLLALMVAVAKEAKRRLEIAESKEPSLPRHALPTTASRFNSKRTDSSATSSATRRRPGPTMRNSSANSSN